MPQSTKQVIKINETDLYYETHGQGKPLLILHGFLGSSAGLAETFDQLTQAYQLIIPDLPGHGHSTSHKDRVFTFKRVADDLLCLLEQLNINCIDAIGLSGGGNGLLHMASQQPQRFQSLALVSATAYYPEQARNLMRQFYLSEENQTEWLDLLKIHHFGKEQVQRLIEQARCFSEDYTDMNFKADRLSTISAKTLIMHGDRDPFYGVESSLDLFHSIPNSSLWVVPNGGHVPLSKDIVQAFIAYILKNF